MPIRDINFRYLSNKRGDLWRSSFVFLIFSINVNVCFSPQELAGLHLYAPAMDLLNIAAVM